MISTSILLPTTPICLYVSCLCRGVQTCTRGDTGGAGSLGFEELRRIDTGLLKQPEMKEDVAQGVKSVLGERKRHEAQECV